MHIVLRLCVPELSVEAVLLGKQRGMGPLLDDAAILEHQNFVTEFAAGQPMADIDGGFVPGYFVEFFVDFRLRNGVQGGGGFVQDDEGASLGLLFPFGFHFLIHRIHLSCRAYPSTKKRPRRLLGTNCVFAGMNRQIWGSRISVVKAPSSLLRLM